MKSLIILILTLASAFAVPGNEIKARNVVLPAGLAEGRISKGQTATVNQFRYQVGLSLKGKDSGLYWCGASLIGHEWVLTAAHCTLNAIQATVFMGKIEYRSYEVKHVVDGKHFHNHEKYNRLSLQNDIALIRIPYTNYTDSIKAVELPALNSTYPDYDGAIPIASGWGRTGKDASTSALTLQWQKLEVIPNDVCQKSFNYVRIMPNHLCTSAEGGVNTCKGDSGGPLVLRDINTQIGVVSFGDEDCTKIIPGIYARVHSYLKWIQEITGIAY